MRLLKIQSKTLLNMKMIVTYLNFVFHIEVKQNLTIKNRISFFNLSKTRNGTLGTGIINDYVKIFVQFIDVSYFVRVCN